MRERISSFILIVSVILTVVFFVSLFFKAPYFIFFSSYRIPRIQTQTQSHSHLFLFLLCYLVMFQFFFVFLHNYLHLSRA